MQKTILGLCLVTSWAGQTAIAQTTPVETTLYNFKGTTDGANPPGTLIADSKGVLYGTASSGGAKICAGGCGAVFKLTPTKTAWVEKTLLLFKGGADGGVPQAGLIADSAGNLYGTTYQGGTANKGVVFELSPPATGQTLWTETVLYSFATTTTDGANPYAGLTAGPKATLYGTTYNGGLYSNGIAFRLTPPATGKTAWTLTNLHDFKAGRDGAHPFAGVTLDAAGVVYGTTFHGGAACPTISILGCGVVYSLTPPTIAKSPWTAKILHAFKAGATDASLPYAGLIADSTGSLYGTSFNGGTANLGTIYKLAAPAPGKTAWPESILYAFTGTKTDAALPQAGLIANTAGALYGTSTQGGTTNTGTIFKLTPPATGQTTWTASLLNSFTKTQGTGNPRAGLLADTAGTLYGTTYTGGTANVGTVFKLVP